MSSTRALLSVDVQGSSDPGRNNADSARLRGSLFGILEKAVREAGIDWGRCVRQDSGDGMIITVPREHGAGPLVHPLLGSLAEDLRRHNRASPALQRIRLRVAVHEGTVLESAGGLTGRPYVLLARLLDAPELRTALAGTPPAATVAALISDRVHEDVVAAGHPEIDPETYHPVRVSVKETTVRAWLHVPGRWPGTEPPPKPAASPEGQAGTVSFHGSGNVRISDSVLGGNQYNYGDRE